MIQKACKQNNYFYNSALQERARFLRKNGTKSEAYLWKFALKNKIMGFQFFRQRPILNYIVDFVCFDLMLIIEADGITHIPDEAKIKDQNRQNNLEAIGFTFLRFDDTVILNNLHFALGIIETTIKELSLKHSSSVLRTSPLKENNTNNRF